LQAAARPGTVLVGEKVHRQMRLRFKFQAPVKLQLRGIDTPVVAYELVGKRSEPEPMRGLAGRQAPLIGRYQEYELLIAGLEKLTIDHQGVVSLITGEAGVGKSRLAEEILLPTSQGFEIVRTQSSEIEATGYVLLRDLLKKLIGIMPDDGLSTQQSRLEEFLFQIGDIGEDVAVIFEELLYGRSTTELSFEDPHGYQRRLIVAFRRLFTRLCNQKPLAMLFDDVQWADSSSMDVISHLIKLTFEIYLAMIFVARSEFRERLPDYLQLPNFPRSTIFLDIHLQALSYEECDHLVAALLGEMELPSLFKQSIFLRTAGNPLYIEELIRMLIDHEIIRLEDGAWILRNDWSNFIEKVPETVNALLLSRYDHQPEHRRVILDSASVIGSSFHLSLLALVLDIPDSKLREEMRGLVEVDFIRRSPGVGSPVYAFRHALMQEAIYETILLEDRSKLHRRVGDVLVEIGEQFYVDADAVIGHHFELCNSDDAISYLIKAASQAAERYANDEAISYFERILSSMNHIRIRKQLINVAIGYSEVLNRTGDSRAVLEQLQIAINLPDSHHLSDYRRVDVYYQLGFAYGNIGNRNKSLNYFSLAATALDKDPNGPHSFHMTDIEREIGWVLFFDGKFSEGLPHALSALDLAKQEGRLDSEGSAHKLLSSVYFRTGQVQEAIASAENSLRIREKLCDAWGAASSQTALGYFYHQIGKWLLSEKMLRQAIYVQIEVGDKYNLASSWVNLGLLLLDKGQHDEALECMNEAVSILPIYDFPLSDVSMIHQNRGLAFLRSGNPDEAINDFEIGLENAQKQSNTDWIALANAYLADGFLDKGMIKKAEEMIKNALGIVDDKTSNEFKVEVYRVKSIISSAQGDFKDAYQENLIAQDLCSEIGNRFQRASLIIDEADIFLAQDEKIISSDDIIADLEFALGTFQHLGAEHDIVRAEEYIFRIMGDQTVGQEQLDEKWVFPVVVVDVHLSLPNLADEQLDQVLVAKRGISDELKKFADKQNIFFSAIPSGFSLILSNIYTQAIDRMALNAVEVAQSVIMSCVRLNKSLRRNYGFELQMKIGIAIGTVNELICNQEQAALFSNVSQLGRQADVLAEIANDLQVILTGEIPANLYDSFELELLPEHEDRRVPQQVYLLGEAVSSTGYAHDLPQASSKLIGRAGELELICDRINHTRATNRGSITYIEAEAGMGKTRLLKEVRESLGEKYMFLNGKCEAFRSNISFWPLIEILENVYLPEISEYLRLKSILGMRPPDEADEALLSNLPPDAVNKEIFASVREFLIKLSEQQPLVLVFEDVHFVDLSSLDLLDYLISVIDEAPISMILISRSEMPGPHRAFVKKVERIFQQDHLQISFSELGKQESLDLIRDLLDSDELPDGLGALYEQFVGHPLSIEEATRLLVEQRWLQKINHKWVLADSLNSILGQMPKTYREVLLRRLNRLDAESLHVLQAAALLGEVFDRITLKYMISESSFGQRLTELSKKGWFQKSDVGNPSQFHFNHTLTRETIYSTLVRSKKQLLHQRAGEAFEFLYPEYQEENLEILAHHFENSGLLDKNLYYTIRAAEKCARRHALEESRRFFRKAESILDQRYQPQSRMMIRVLLGLADSHLSLGEPLKAVESSEKLVAGSEELPKSIRAACFRRVGSARQMQGDMEAALDLFQRAHGILNITDESIENSSDKHFVSIEEEQIEIQVGLARIYFDLHRNLDAKEQAVNSLDSLDQDRYPASAARLCNLLSGIMYRERNFEDAIMLAKRGLAINQANGFRDGASDTYSNLGILSVVKQDFESANNYFSLALEINESLGDVEGKSITRNNLGQLKISQGKPSEAIFHLEKSIHYARLSDLTRTMVQAIANKGYALIIAGEMKEASSVLSEGENLSNMHRFGDLLGEVLWKKAECLIATGDTDMAVETVLSAIEQAGKLKRQDIEAQALRTYARALRKRGDENDARDIARQAWQMTEHDLDPQKRAQFALEFALNLFANNQFAEAVELISNHVQGVNLVEPEYIFNELNDAFGGMLASV